MTLTEIALRIAKPEPKAFKLSDAGGMYVLIHPNGSKYFRFDYRFDGKRRTASLGVYPDISLKQARQERDRVKDLLASGIDPSVQKRLLSRRMSSRSRWSLANGMENRLNAGASVTPFALTPFSSETSFHLLEKRPLTRLRPLNYSQSFGEWRQEASLNPLVALES
ncbi:MAG: hypothetical protein RLZ25_2308 [Pseudomonadota bacterium]|jgi:hypothetical protein